ncbi:heterokaryon incompatibility protein-domain-containing protein [Phaeosphaeriaceae sp. PMI808]|nr:heterokaryon incompatibility protein-domain-containing protein [Phaeosphaeriaceae sp. PMI808]
MNSSALNATDLSGLLQDDAKGNSDFQESSVILEAKNELSSICETCSRIPWNDIQDPTITPPKTLATIDHTTEYMKASNCCICRFFADIIVPREYLPNLSRPPYRLILQDRIFIDHQNFSVLELTTQHGGYDPGPHALLLDNPPSSADAQSEPVHLGGIPLGLIKNTIAKCIHEHDVFCSPKDPDTLLNLKVLDCIQKVVVSAPAGCHYVALSYVWGPTHGHSNTRGTRDQEQLPQTILDSCFVAQKLGYRYIWVDRYCIDQGNFQDRHDQIMQMAGIYSAAQLTIVAAAGANADHGLTGIQRIAATDSLQLPLHSCTLQRYPKSFPISSLELSTYGSRAWTFQEFYFSKRRIVFSNGEVMYMCNQAIDGSRIKFGLWGWKPSKPKTAAVNGNDIDAIKTVVRAYTGRQLTYESDALAAIVGALSSFKEMGIGHIWGLPLKFDSNGEDQLKSDTKVELPLLWWHSQPCKRRAKFPSWSPVAWAGKVSWNHEMPKSAYLRCLSHPEIATPFHLDRSIFDSNPEEAPRYLQLNAWSANLTLIRAPSRVLHDNNFAASEKRQKAEERIYLTFPLDDDLEIVLNKVDWDVEPSILDPNKPILGILLDIKVYQYSKTMTSANTTILLVQRHATYYERVGMFRFCCAGDRTRVFNARANDGPLVLHDSLYLRFYEKSSGRIWHHDCGGDPEDIDDHGLNNIPFEFFDDRNWKRFFFEDTIILG